MTKYVDLDSSIDVKSAINNPKSIDGLVLQAATQFCTRPKQSVSVKALSFWLRCTDEEAQKCVDLLLDKGVIVETAEGYMWK